MEPAISMSSYLGFKLTYHKQIYYFKNYWRTMVFGGKTNITCLCIRFKDF